MRRNEREITDKDEIIAILQRANTVRIAFSDEKCPYIVPMSFGLEDAGGDLTLYFHCAGEGRKLELLRKSPRVCFEADGGFELMTGEKACMWSCRYESVIGEGEMRLAETREEKRRGLDAVMRHYSGKGGWDYPDAMLDRTTVLILPVDTVSGKRH